MTTTSAPAGFLRRNGIWVATAVALCAAIAVSLWTTAGDPGPGDRLDPESFRLDGARAVTQVLAGQGVEVSVARSAAELEAIRVHRATTVVVTGSHQLTDSTTDRLLEHAAAGRLVMVEPHHDVLDRFAEHPELRYADVTGRLTAECSSYDGLDLAVDQLTLFSDDYEGCFPTAHGVALAEDPAAVLLGTGDLLTNDQVLRGDNAAIALRLLGEQPRLVWYVPTWNDASADEAAGLGDLLPPWILPSLWLGLAAAGVLVLWRFRRLGPLAVEPLPVVVRAVETTRSRGRLYHRSNDRAHAAAALRRATRDRLAERLRLGPQTEEAAVLTAAAEYLERPHPEVVALLDSNAPPPGSDADLVRLADELARLDPDREVTHP